NGLIFLSYSSTWLQAGSKIPLDRFSKPNLRRATILRVKPATALAQWVTSTTMTFSTLIQFIGHLHPMLVHLPIGFLIVLGTLEAAALFPRFKHLAVSSRAILVLTVPVTAASVACGWILADNSDYDANLLFWHRWLGVGIGVATVVLLILH